MSRRYAVIEIGTRGLRLLVADASSKGIERVVRSTGEFSELGQNQTSEGIIPSQLIDRTKAIVSRYLDVANQYKVNRIVAIATEAVRSAKNRTKFLQEMSSLLEIRVLQPAEEALYSLVATINAFRDQIAVDENILVIDQGGGSTELCFGSRKLDGTIVLQGYESLPLGTAWLNKLFYEAGTLMDSYKRIDQIVRLEINRHRNFINLSLKDPIKVFGLGSAITIVAKRVAPQNSQGGISLSDLHGQFIAKETLRKFLINSKRELTRLEKTLTAHVNAESDLATLLTGLSTYYYILNKYRASGITVSRHGVRYGLLLSLAGQQSLIQLISDARVDS